jgi:hypothetical protein
MKLRKLYSLNDAHSYGKFTNRYSFISMTVDYSFVVAAKFYKKNRAMS